MKLSTSLFLIVVSSASSTASAENKVTSFFLRHRNLACLDDGAVCGNGNGPNSCNNCCTSSEDGEVCGGSADFTGLCSGVTCSTGEICDETNGSCIEDVCDGVECQSGYVCDTDLGYCKADEGTSCELCSLVAPCDTSQQLSCVPNNRRKTGCGSPATCQRIG